VNAESTKPGREDVFLTAELYQSFRSRTVMTMGVVALRFSSLHASEEAVQKGTPQRADKKVAKLSLSQ
jgi:hypothetical protein